MSSEQRPRPKPMPIHMPDFTRPDDTVPELQPYDAEHMGGLTINRYVWENGMDPDFTPEVDQDIWLNERPGEMAADALTVLHQGADYDQERHQPYPHPLLTIRDGDGQANTRRTRHMSLLDNGLEQGDR